jgi:YggT family protein
VGLFLSTILNTATTIIIIAIILRALLSFAPLDPYHPLVRLLHQFTEPFLRPIRNLMPSMGMMDFSPMIAILLLSVVNRVLQQILISLFP